jgi:hypothetical protein
MLPLSYQGFGFTAILVMIAILSAGQLLKYLKERVYHHRHRTVIEELTNDHSVKK